MFMNLKLQELEETRREKSRERSIALWEQRFLGPDGRVNPRLLGSRLPVTMKYQAAPKHCSYQKYRTNNWN